MRDKARDLGTEGGGRPERHRETRAQDALGKALQRNTLNMCVCVYTYIVLILVCQSCPTLCNPMDCSTPGSSVCGMLQARIL